MGLRRTAAGILSVALAASTASAAAAEEPVRRARWLMGTSCVGEAYGPDADVVAAALGEAFDAIAAAESMLSTWRDDSELSRVNRRAVSRPAPLTPDLARFLETSLRLARASGGAFDPTIGPLVRAWDLRGAGRLPSGPELRAARARVGEAKVRLDPAAGVVRFLAPGLWIDPGAIGKGWALDRAGEVLRRRDVAGALLDFGGQLVALGSPPDGEAWPVAVARPDDRGRPALLLALTGGSVATSGQSERGRLVGGRWLGHILDPRSGEPVPRSGSVTVVGASAAEADALATALFVMGPEEGLAWAEARAGIAVGYLERVSGRTDGARLRLRANPLFRSMVIASPEDLLPESAPAGTGADPEEGR